MSKATATTAAPTPKPALASFGLLQRCGGRQCPPGTCDHHGGETLRRDARGHAGGGAVPPVVHQVLRSPGRPLDGGTRSFMESRLGHDFSGVRVHTDQRAAASAAVVASRAYTVGRDIAFAAGQYAPGTSEGRRLIAHELTHVVQQGNELRRAAPSAIGHPGDALEQEADAVARGVDGGGATPSVSRSDHAATATVRRQPNLGALGCGLVNDPVTNAPMCVNHGGCAGTCRLVNPFPLPPYCTCDPGGPQPPQPPVPLPTPPLPLPGPLPTPPVQQPGPPPPPPAPPPVIRAVEVENSREAITYQVPSNRGAAGRQHWVTIAGSRPDVVVRAITDPPVPAGDPALAGLTWESDPPGMISAGGDILHSTAAVPTARKVVVRAVLGASAAELTLWAVFVRLTSPGPALPAPTRMNAPPSTFLQFNPTIHVDGRVNPPSIINDPDHPALEGGRTVPPPPPGGTNICGTPLDGGADHRWDMSRQRRLRNEDPTGLQPALSAASPPACLDMPSAYPGDPEIGNDDTDVTDETNNPYANGSMITSDDNPAYPFDDSVGADGDTFGRILQFREFARLDYHRTWWNVSGFLPWRVHYRVIKVAGHWRDNGSDAALNNAGF